MAEREGLSRAPALAASQCLRQPNSLPANWSNPLLGFSSPLTSLKQQNPPKGGFFMFGGERERHTQV